MAEIMTERTILRPIQEADAVDLNQIMKNAEAMRYLRYDIPKTLEDTKEFIRQNFVNNAMAFGIENKDNGRLIGFFEFHNAEEIKGEATITYILDSDFWGYGIMTEVGKKLIGYAFDHFNFARIVGHYEFDKNPRSGRAMKKMGMIADSEVTDHEYDGLKFRVGSFSVTNEQFRKEK